MKFVDKCTIPSLLEYSFSRFMQNKSFSFVDEKQNTYADLQKQIYKIGNLLRKLDIKKGDKVAILAANSPQWVASYMAIGAIGGVVVPILPDFSATEVKNILEHSLAKAVFVSEKLVQNIPFSFTSHIIKIENQSLLSSSNSKLHVENDYENLSYEDIAEDDLLAIIYTSGTTGTSKGVMLTHKNIIFNAKQCLGMQEVNEKDRFLSILPLSHTFENTLGMIIPFMCGSSVYYLKKLPTPAVLLPAMEKIKPTMFLLVPLVIEKIYKSKILKQINSKKITKYLYKVRPFQKILNNIAGKKLYQAFGGELKFFGIGGAKLNSTVEQFLLDCDFPYSIGYGMTECAPVINGAFGKNRKVGFAGVSVEGLELRIFKEKISDKIGEIQVRGPNMMKGYYKAPELNKEVFTDDGWLRTGDLGMVDKKGQLSIRGRLKTMILGSSGENIYPEEIESVINKMDLVLESLVTQRGGKLVAMVYVNMEELEDRLKRLHQNMISFKDDAMQYTDETKKYLEQKAQEALKEIRPIINQELNKFSQIHQIILQSTPFEKTPTHKIKRFLYA